MLITFLILVRQVSSSSAFSFLDTIKIIKQKIEIKKLKTNKITFWFVMKKIELKIIAKTIDRNKT